MQGSIIGAGRLSFRVRDGTGRFPVAVTAVTLFGCCSGVRTSVCGAVSLVTVILVFGGGVWCVWSVVAGSCASIFLRHSPVGCLGFVVSFRPVSASSLNALLRV